MATPESLPLLTPSLNAASNDCKSGRDVENESNLNGNDLSTFVGSTDIDLNGSSDSSNGSADVDLDGSSNFSKAKLIHHFCADGASSQSEENYVFSDDDDVLHDNLDYFMSYSRGVRSRTQEHEPHAWWTCESGS